MSDQSSSTSSAGGSAAPPSGSGSSGIGDLTSHAPSPTPAVHEPITQARETWRSRLPVWMQQIPQFSFPRPNPDFQLIDRERLMAQFKDADPATVKRVEEDMQFLEQELLRFFRDRDYEASRRQNQYRLYQIAFIVLAALATLIGSLQALSLNSDGGVGYVPFFAFLETFIALLATFLATISGREPPLPLWLTNRRRAESLRREYFRYLMDMPPYDSLDGYQRRLLLSRRAADVNRGVFPDEGNT